LFVLFVRTFLKTAALNFIPENGYPALSHRFLDFVSSRGGQNIHEVAVTRI
jgi:hypothetical protein